MTTPEQRRPDAFYPIRFDIDFEADRSRLTNLFRLPLAMPCLFVTLLLVLGVVPGVWATVLVTGRIPGWILAFERLVLRWHASATAYALVLTDVAPVVEPRESVGHLAVHLQLK